MKAQDRFDDMRERAVADVVEQRGDTNCSSVLRGDRIFGRQPVKNTRRQMIRSQTVRKTGMLGRLIGEMRQAKLPYAPKPLKLRRIYQPRYERTHRINGIDTNYVVNRVAVDPF